MTSAQSNANWSGRLVTYMKERGLSSDDLLFSTEKCTHISRNTFRTRVWINARRAAGVEETTMHGLRHGHASWLLAGGVDIQRVKERLGHASIATTEKYLHTLDDDTDDVVDAFSAIRGRNKKPDLKVV
jgi:site-specific recombinase XerD